MDKIDEKLDYLIKKLDNLESRITNLENSFEAQNSGALYNNAGEQTSAVHKLRTNCEKG